MISHVRLLAALVALAVAAGGHAMAQIAPDTQFGQPGSERPALPQFEEEPKLRFTLPPLEIPPGQQLSTSVIVFVRKFVFAGNTTFSDDELAEVTAPYEGREITTADLLAVRQAITLYYVSRGYINSGATIPDQDVSAGSITLNIVEGTLTSTEVSGNISLRDGYIINRLAGSEGEILNVNELRERFQLLLQDPLITSLNAELGPGVAPGEAELKVIVEEDTPHHAVATISNHHAPSIGAEGVEINLVLRGLTGWGDTLELDVEKTKGSITGSLDFAIPITASDTFLRFGYELNNSEVIEAPFNEIDIESKSQTIEISLDHPLYRTSRQRLTVGLTLARRESETFLLGVPFTFSPGAKNGKSTVTALRFYQGWIDRTRTRVVAARSTISWGIPAFGATKNVDTPDGEFLTWLGQMQIAQRLWESDSQVIFRADAQLSRDRLLPIEKFAVGGANSVRGYRESQLVRDNGFVFSIEGRFPVATVPIPGLSQGSEDGVVSLAPFFDLGRSWDKGVATPSPRTLYSGGIGLRWNISSKIQMEIYWGHGFRKIDNPEHNLQDEGIHFLLSTRLF